MTVTINGTSGITFPAGGTGNTAGAAVGTTDTQTLTNKTLGSGLVAGASLITSGTSQASTSGTSIDFTGIPSWVKRITVVFNQVSTNGTSFVQVQLGSGSVVTSGYNSASSAIATTVATNTASSGFILNLASATSSRVGAMLITNISGNIWVTSGAMGDPGNGQTCTFGGQISLSGTLDRVRITTVNGTDTFDAGSINIMYE